MEEERKIFNCRIRLMEWMNALYTYQQLKLLRFQKKLLEKLKKENMK